MIPAEFQWIGRAVENFGAAGLLAWLLWRIVDKWAGQFLSAQQSQANAMGSLAQAVREGQTDQREILIAVGVIGRRIEEQREYLIAIDQNLQGKARGGDGGAQ